MSYLKWAWHCRLGAALSQGGRPPSYLPAGEGEGGRERNEIEEPGAEEEEARLTDSSSCTAGRSPWFVMFIVSNLSSCRP